MKHNIIRAISRSGHCSRKEALGYVLAGKVSVNGRPVADPGYKISGADRITLGGQKIVKKNKRYILLNKPAGYVTTRKDELGRPTVYELLKDVKGWVFPVGRLDRDSEGLLIFTNDTEYGNYLTDPKYNIERTYQVLVSGELSEENMAKMVSGIDIGHGEVARPLKVRSLSGGKGSSLIEITLNEGKNREIRRMLKSLGIDIMMLKRTRYGPYKLGDLKPGRWTEVKIATHGRVR